MWLATRMAGGRARFRASCVSSWPMASTDGIVSPMPHSRDACITPPDQLQGQRHSRYITRNRVTKSMRLRRTRTAVGRRGTFGPTVGVSGIGVGGGIGAATVADVAGPRAVVGSTSITAASRARSLSLAGRLLGFLASRLASPTWCGRTSA